MRSRPSSEDAGDERIASLLDSHGAEACEDGRLLLKRVLPSEGAGRQFVNGSPCTLAVLRALGDLLVDLHGPHDHQSLFSRDQQTLLLDSFSGAENLRRQFERGRTLLELLRRKKRPSFEMNRAPPAKSISSRTRSGRSKSAGLEPGEEEILLSRQRVATNARRIRRALRPTRRGNLG